MPKYIGRLAQADYHPGTAVLRDIATGQTFYQFPLTQAKAFLGGRKEAFYLVSICQGTYHLDEEIPVEDIPQWREKLYPPPRPEPV